MLKTVLLFSISVMMLTPIGIAESITVPDQQITLTTDNTSYVEGDVITISGKINKVISGFEVSIQIFTSSGNPIGISQTELSTDGKFTDVITTGGPLWKNDDKITIRATYGDTSTELIVEFYKITTEKYQLIHETKIPGAGTFDVPYTMKGGKVTDMKLDKENLSLDIDIIAENDGFLDISLSRDNIDSMSESGQDIDYIVLIYEKDSNIPIQTEFTKKENNDTYRGISIPIKEGDSKIKIIGTYVVPEFGTIAMIVLAVAIVSIIAVSAKSRLSIMPRI